MSISIPENTHSSCSSLFNSYVSMVSVQVEVEDLVPQDVTTLVKMMKIHQFVPCVNSKNTTTGKWKQRYDFVEESNSINSQSSITTTKTSGTFQSGSFDALDQARDTALKALAKFKLDGQVDISKTSL